MRPTKAIFCWSGGKDSSYALYKVLQEGVYEVKYLLSTFNGNYNRLSMHGVREELIEAQAESIGIPLLKVYVYEASNAEYEKQMEETLLRIKKEGIDTVLYGDIFLEDLREYREKKMAPLAMQCVFPIWKTDTRWMLNDFIAQGFKTIVCCINDGYLNEDWCGRLIDEAFIRELPSVVDPCGENGEFHTFCFDGPVFKKAIPVTRGEKTYKKLELKTNDHPTPIKDVGTRGFWFSDLLLQS
ncbi:MAG: diphthine--ammonia ligase [Bacteroidota bacterium]|nr:diphthine--ammonia ligase [Bacteroidota bacterium]